MACSLYRPASLAGGQEHGRTIPSPAIASQPSRPILLSNRTRHSVVKCYDSFDRAFSLGAKCDGATSSCLSVVQRWRGHWLGLRNKPADRERLACCFGVCWAQIGND